MKKGIVLLCVAALLLSAATAAVADPNWMISIKAGSGTGGTMGGTTTASLGASPTAFLAGAGEPGSTSADIATFVGSNYYSTQRQVTSETPATALYTFNVVIARGSGMGADLWITGWNFESIAFPASSGWTLPANYEVKWYQGEDLLATWAAADMFRSSAPTATTPGPVGFAYTSKGAASSYAASADIFTVTVGAPVVPEPGSLLALGSGLVGFAGFALRRRRA